VVARQAHNLKVLGSIPSPATNTYIASLRTGFFYAQIAELSSKKQESGLTKRQKTGPFLVHFGSIFGPFCPATTFLSALKLNRFINKITIGERDETKHQASGTKT
jgi:hypothetical protein